ncbi:uncharacterized protein BDR25DRAFT_355552 [Lindgomyces ingoldianus]|uniref:Uncharacterized protein n=1 Tax=Lindgomyces ingoldianus TaxID=673940 RepID=A0ACB6QTV4_9PLEO|nr:uncharacterized protein BDR25DRAFT_355552 [Lindgomyces ingoldianus]KAF2470448.1 hypothetical protein BDR25DRAFT_355552 [Lindgomyces ingoldianus]
MNGYAPHVLSVGSGASIQVIATCLVNPEKTTEHRLTHKSLKVATNIDYHIIFCWSTPMSSPLLQILFSLVCTMFLEILACWCRSSLNVSGNFLSQETAGWPSGQPRPFSLSIVYSSEYFSNVRAIEYCPTPFKNGEFMFYGEMDVEVVGMKTYDVSTKGPLSSGFLTTNLVCIDFRDLVI